MILLILLESKKGMEMANTTGRETWITPEIRDLDVQETNARPGPGNDVGGNALPDCQAS